MALGTQEHPPGTAGLQQNVLVLMPPAGQPSGELGLPLAPCSAVGAPGCEAAALCLGSGATASHTSLLLPPMG